MPGQQPVVDEPGQGQLGGRLAVAVGELAGGAERLAQRRRRDQVAGAQRGEQGLGEGADVDHPAVLVEAVQRVQRALHEPELAVVVVLDDRGVVPGGVRQQRVPAGQRQRRTERELVRGRGEHQPAAPRQQVDDQALVVDRHRHDRRAVGGEQVAGERVAGVLDGHHVARLQQHPRDQVQRLLGAVGGDHVLRVGLDAAGVGQVPGHRRAQRRMPLGGGVRPGLGARGAPGRRAAGARCRTGRGWGRGCRPGSRRSGSAPTRSPGAGAGPTTGAAAARSGGRAGSGRADRGRRRCPHRPASPGGPRRPAARRPWTRSPG